MGSTPKEKVKNWLPDGLHELLGAGYLLVEVDAGA
jgi:hypothetical protein